MSSNLLVLIVDDLEKLPALLKAWEAIGVGVTILDSRGGYRTRTWLERIGLAGPLQHAGQRGIEHPQKLLLSVIDEPSLLERAIAEADRAMGGFDRPNSGILFVLPIHQTLGLKKWVQPASEEGEEQPDQSDSFASINLKTPVSKIIQVLNLKPVIVRPDSTIEEIVAEMLQCPSVNVVCVVNAENRLIGLIDFDTLTETVFYSIFPETYLSRLHDVETVMDFTTHPHQADTAADIMQEAAYVRADDTLASAFRTLSEQKLPGLPVVDEHYRITGYINLLELLAICYQKETAPEPKETPTDKPS